MKIAVAGPSLSNDMPLEQNNEVLAVDIVDEKVALFNSKQFLVEDT